MQRWHCSRQGGTAGYMGRPRVTPRWHGGLHGRPKEPMPRQHSGLHGLVKAHANTVQWVHAKAKAYAWRLNICTGRPTLMQKRHGGSQGQAMLRSNSVGHAKPSSLAGSKSR